MELDFNERRILRQEAKDTAYEEAALLCDGAALRLLGGRTRVHAVERHTADVLQRMGEQIRALKGSSGTRDDHPEGGSVRLDATQNQG